MDGGPTFGEWVRRYRRQRHLTQQQLAEKVGTDKAGMNLIEGDKREPGHDLAQRIVAALEAPPEPFLRALGYPVGSAYPDALASIEATILSESTLSEERKQAGLVVMRDLFAQSKEQAS